MEAHGGITRRRIRHLVFAVATVAEIAAGLVAGKSTSSVVGLVLICLAFAVGASAPRRLGVIAALGAVLPGVVIGASQPGGENESFGFLVGLDVPLLLVLVVVAAIGAASRRLAQSLLGRRHRDAVPQS